MKGKPSNYSNKIKTGSPTRVITWGSKEGHMPDLR